MSQRENRDVSKQLDGGAQPYTKKIKTYENMKIKTKKQDTSMVAKQIEEFGTKIQHIARI